MDMQCSLGILACHDTVRQELFKTVDFCRLLAALALLRHVLLLCWLLQHSHGT